MPRGKEKSACLGDAATGDEASIGSR